MILIALGGNLPTPDGSPPLSTCGRAVDALSRLPGLRLVARSAWHETPPVPPSGQPDYVNGVVRLAGRIEGADLLHRLQAIEAGFGRVRSVANAARTLDLDIIDLNGLVSTAPDLVLPHPRAHLRAFVLAPLHEVAPDWRHPLLGRSARELWSALLE